MDFHGGGTVAEEGRALGTVDVEHVRVVGDGDAEVCECAVDPLLLKLFLLEAFEAELGENAGDDVLVRND